MTENFGDTRVKEVVHAYEKKVQCLCDHIQEHQRQVVTLKDELEVTRGKLNASCQEQEQLRRQLAERNDIVCALQGQLENLKYDTREKDRAATRVTNTLQEKLSKLQELTSCKDSALLLCKNELKTHVAALEEFKTTYNCDMHQKENCIDQLKNDLRCAYDELKGKSEQNALLERNIVELKARIRQVCGQTQEAEGKSSCLQEKIHMLECQAAKEKQDRAKDMEELERKLAQSYTDASNIQAEMRRLRRCIEDKEEEFQTVLTEKTNLCHELQCEKEKASTLKEQALAKEQENKEICRLLKHKVKHVQEVEQSLCIKEEELRTCQCCVEELSAKIRQLNTGVSQTAEEEQAVDDAPMLREQLKQCRAKVEQLQKELADTVKKLEWASREMEILAKEIKRLNCELEESKKEISEKNSMISDLETNFEHAQKDMESRMMRVDCQLQKYEAEIREKTNMVSSCDEKTCHLQHMLEDKDTEIDHLQELSTKLTGDVNSFHCRNNELEQERDSLQQVCKETAAQCAELAQEVKLLRQQCKQCQEESKELTRGVTCTKKELDITRCEAEETRILLQEKDAECRRVSEEKNCLATRLASLQRRLDSETTELTQQMAQLKARLEKEIERLKLCQMELEETNAGLIQKLTSGQRHLQQMEKSFSQKVETVIRDNEMVQAKLSEKEDQLQATRDCLTIKDSEIMRLKLRMCSIDRCNSSVKSTACCSGKAGNHMLTCAVAGAMSSSGCSAGGGSGSGGGAGGAGCPGCMMNKCAPTRHTTCCHDWQKLVKTQGKSDTEKSTTD